MNVSDSSVKKYSDIEIRADAGGHHKQCGVPCIVSGNAPQYLWCKRVLCMSEARQPIGATDQ